MVFDSAHLPYWLLLGMGIILFSVTIFSGLGDFGLDLDADLDLDLDLDVDIDADLDLDADIDADADNGASGSSSAKVLQFLGALGFGRAPLLLMLAIDLSLWGGIGWFINASIGLAIGGLPSGILALPIFFGSLAIALWLGSQISTPLAKVFSEFGEDTSEDRLIGCLGSVSSLTIPKQSERKIGQVDLLDPARNRVTVSAVLPDWASTLPQRGQEVVAIERQAATYLVVVKDSPDWQQWLATAQTLSK